MHFSIPDPAAIEVADELFECDSESEGQASSVADDDCSVDRSLVAAAAAAFDKVSEEPYPAETADVDRLLDSDSVVA